MAQAQQARGGKSAAAKLPTTFELKSASLSLLTLLLKSADLGQLALDLRAKLGDTPEVFNHDPLLIDLSQLQRPAVPVPAVAGEPQQQLSLDEEPAPAAIDLPALLALLREYRMQPVALAGATAAERAQGLALGLAEAPDVEPVAARADAPVQEVVREIEVIREVVREVAVPGESAKTLIIDKPLRSGQQIYAKGGDLVVLALVNHGAEVIADGSIHVYAPLRGKAIAGARGDASARIFAASMEAELIAIAGIYRTTENPLPDTVLGKAAQIRLEGEKLVMEPLKL